MKRFGLLLLALLACLALFACGGGEEKAETPADTATDTATEAAAPVETIELTYANFPPAFTVPCVQMEHWKEVVEERTEGQVKVATFPGGTLLKSKNMLRGVIEGQADIGCLSMSYQPGVFPLTTAVEAPVGFSSSRVSSMVLYDLFQKYQPAEFAEVQVLAMFTTPPTNIMSRVPVKTLADLKGVELRASGLPSKYLEALGAAPVSMPMPETPDALQKNLVKGLFSSLEVMLDLKFAELCKHVTIMDGPVYVFAVVMNKAKFDALPENVKQTLTELAPEQSYWIGDYWDKHVAEAMDWSESEQGVQVYELSQEDMDQIATATSGLADGWKAQATEAGLPADQVFQDMLDLKAQYEAKYGK